MSEGFLSALSAWREVLHVSEWTGLSIGALAGLAALFIYVPFARRLAIEGAIVVAVGWFCLVHGDKVGRADVEVQWADARAAAIAAEQERDAMVEQNLEQTYQPKLAELARLAEQRKARSDDYERGIKALLAKMPAAAKAAAGTVCELGAAADRMRRK